MTTFVIFFATVTFVQLMPVNSTYSEYDEDKIQDCVKGESNPNEKLFLEEKEKSDKFIGESLNNIGQTIRKL